MINTRLYKFEKYIKIEDKYVFPHIIQIRLNVTYMSSKKEMKRLYNFLTETFGNCDRDWSWQHDWRDCQVRFKDKESVTYMILCMGGY